MLALDAAATVWVNALAGMFHPLDQAVIAITTMGVPLIIVAVALQWWSRNDRRRERHIAIAGGLSFVLGLLLNQVVLLFIDRLRPYNAGLTHLLVAPSTDASFPSDHATAVFSIVFAYLLHGKRTKALLFAIAGSLVALSRVYVGTHYLGDLLGGVLTGFLAAAMVRATYWGGTRWDRWVTGIF